MTYKSEVSSEILYHFTKSPEVIKSILENGFYPRVSREDISVVLPGYEGRPERFTGIPMICFTDIPLNLSEAHRKDYGHFGLGLNKKWAERNKLGPVFYMQKGSGSWEAFNHMQYVVVQELMKHGEINAEIMSSIIEFAGYIKPYSAEGREKPFYDEREWRYLPPFRDTPDYSNWLMHNDLTDEKIQGLNEKMRKHYALKFSDDDLEELVISECQDISRLIQVLRSVKCREPEELIRKIKQV